jgi:hypothetical protein
MIPIRYLSSITQKNENNNNNNNNNSKLSILTLCNALSHGHYQNWDVSTLPSVSSYIGNAHGLGHITLHFSFNFQMVIIGVCGHY